MNIPANIKDMLEDEAYLETALSLLKEARVEQAAAANRTRATRTPFTTLFPFARGKSESRESVREAEDQVAKTDEAISHTETIRAKLDAEVRKLVEAHLRRTETDFVRGLDSCNHVTTWLIALNRYKTMLRGYMTDLGQARNTVVAGYDKATRKISNTASSMLARAVDTATSLDRETIAINRLADEYKKRVSNTPADSTELPRLPQNPYREWTQKLQQMDIGPMLAEYDRIIKVCESVAENDATQMRNKAERLTNYSKELSNQHVLQQTDIMRRHTRMQGIDNDLLEERVARIEKRFAQTVTEWSVGF